ncbi:MAG: hypothetical protein LIO81_11505 [Clostridiales bacterium]|nr:hypothetical protein [Clostridiales bacterium]
MNPDDNNREPGLTTFDYQLSDPRLQMLKAAIPYLPLSQQRIVSLLVRFQELRHTADLFSGGELTAMGLQPEGNHVASPVEMLQAMKPYAGPKERDMIEMLENIQIMWQTMQAAG